MEIGDYLSVKQFAQLKGVSQQRIRKLILEGRIQAVKVGSQWIIHSVATWQRRAPFVQDIETSYEYNPEA